MEKMFKASRKRKFNRRSEALTNYKKRLALVKGGMERVVVRRTNRRIIGQIVGYEEKGDKVMMHVDSDRLKKYGWPGRSNRPTGYLTGMLLAKEARKLGDREYVLDIGLAASTGGSVQFAFAKGCVDNGMKLRGKFEIDEKTYNGSGIAKYAEMIKGNKNAHSSKEQFKEYEAGNVRVEGIEELFNKVRESIKKEA